MIIIATMGVLVAIVPFFVLAIVVRFRLFRGAVGIVATPNIAFMLLLRYHAWIIVRGIVTILGKDRDKNGKKEDKDSH